MAQYNINPSYIAACLNNELQHDLGGGTTFNGSFKVMVDSTGHYIDVIPPRPGSFAITAELYHKMGSLLAADLFPAATLIPSVGMNVVERPDQPLETARALRFYYRPGIPHRLSIATLNSLHPDDERIRLMDGLSINVTKGVPHCAVSGTTGSGKTVLSLILLQYLSQLGRVVIVDAKGDPWLKRWASRNRVTCLTPQKDATDAAFTNAVMAELKRAVDLIYTRQRMLRENPRYRFKNYTLFVDEARSLTTLLATNSSLKRTYLGLIDRITLMGRQSNVSLFLTAQSFEAGEVVSSAAREQFLIRVLLGNINRESTRYLFKQLENPSSIMVPDDGIPYGKGIIQVGDHPVMPLLCPYVESLEG